MSNSKSRGSASALKRTINLGKSAGRLFFPSVFPWIVKAGLFSSPGAIVKISSEYPLTSQGEEGGTIQLSLPLISKSKALRRGKVSFFLPGSYPWGNIPRRHAPELLMAFRGHAVLHDPVQRKVGHPRALVRHGDPGPVIELPESHPSQLASPARRPEGVETGPVSQVLAVVMNMPCEHGVFAAFKASAILGHPVRVSRSSFFPSFWISMPSSINQGLVHEDEGSSAFFLSSARAHLICSSCKRALVPGPPCVFRQRKERSCK